MKPLKFTFEENSPFLGKDYENHVEALEDLVTKFPIQIRNVNELTEEEYIKSRNNSFGASDSAVLMEVAYSSKTVEMKTKEELMYEKTNEVYDEEIGKKASVRKGKDLEPLIIEKLQKMLKAIIIKPKHTYWDEHGLSTNFDGIVFEPINGKTHITDIQAVPMEIKVCTMWARKNYNWSKSVSEEDYDGEIGFLWPEIEQVVTDNLPEYIKQMAAQVGIPPYYYTQMQQQIYFTGSDHGFLAVLDDVNWTLHVFLVPRDRFIIKELKRIGWSEYIVLASVKGLPLPENLDSGDDI